MFIHGRIKLEAILKGLHNNRGFKYLDRESFLLPLAENRSSNSGFTKMCLGEKFRFYLLKEKMPWFLSKPDVKTAVVTHQGRKSQCKL